jgi:hypothetical protein
VKVWGVSRGGNWEITNELTVERREPRTNLANMKGPGNLERQRKRKGGTPESQEGSAAAAKEKGSRRK